ncbi:hypothetical protein [Acidiferrimicrobium sp. IK]|uniref:hypothetical protein n=1 Tax=Acidiferrimicrobium sp. IK TaxID=2871700 RepID=UPI0039672E10
MFNPATGPETTHMILAALMVAGFGVASGTPWRSCADGTTGTTVSAFSFPLTGAAIVVLTRCDCHSSSD